MKTKLSILNSKGDEPLVWDHTDPADVAKARTAVAALKALGYSFFLADGTTPADEVAAGYGQLNFKRVSAEALLKAEKEDPKPETPDTLPDVMPSPECIDALAEPVAEEKPKGKGGRRLGSKNKVKTAVAVPPMAGG